MRNILFLMGYCFVSMICQAQSTGPATSINLGLPLDGSVYQQGNDGRGTIKVGGSLNSQNFFLGRYASITAKLIGLDVYTGDPLSPAVEYRVNLSRNGTAFFGEATVPAGWYLLAINTNLPAANNAPQSVIPGTRPIINYLSRSIKVGVGEVFIIGGQSNAQGLPNRPDKDDINIAQPRPTATTADGIRVQPIDVNTTSVDNTPSPNDPNLFYNAVYGVDMSKIKAAFIKPMASVASVRDDQGIAPTGASLWYWAELGRKIAGKFAKPVPVAFFNVAWGGTHIKAWSQSTDGTTGPPGDPRAGSNNFYLPGSPYEVLKKALQTYGSTYGVRAVLWLQGETDALALKNRVNSWGNRAVTDQNDYRDQLHRVIRQTRTDFGDVNWVIGRTSIIGDVVAGSSESNTIETGQTLAVSSAPAVSPIISRVYYGPNMNQLVMARRTSAILPMYGSDEPVHFLRKNLSDGSSPDGLAQAAEAWSQSLNNLYQVGSSAEPILPQAIGTTPETVEISADGQTVSISTTKQVRWVADNNGFMNLDAPLSYNSSMPTNSNGRMRAILVDSKGRYTLTQAIDFPYTVVDDTGTTSTTGVVCAEAEGGNRSPGTEVSSGGNASGGQYVGGFDGASRYVDFPVNVTSAGNYPLTFYYSSGESGGYIDYSINGGGANRQNITANGYWNQFIAAPALSVALNTGANTIRVQGGFRFTLDKICVNGGTTTTPPTGSFALDTPSLNCATNTVTLTTSGGNGSTVEYQAIGLRGWSTNNVFPIPTHQRNGTTFAFQARQSGIEVGQSLTTNCTGPRLGVTASEPDSDGDTGLVISPNPSSGRVSVRFRLGAGERGSLVVQSLTGTVLQSRAVVGTGAAQTEVLDMEREPSGLYLIRVSGGTGKAQTGRVLLMR